MIDSDLLRALFGEIRVAAAPLAEATREKLRQIDEDPLGHIGVELARAAFREEPLENTDDVARVIRRAVNEKP